MWLLSYLIFNACLYAGQLVLYTLLFLPNSDQVMDGQDADTPFCT